MVSSSSTKGKKCEHFKCPNSANNRGEKEKYYPIVKYSTFKQQQQQNHFNYLYKHTQNTTLECKLQPTTDPITTTTTTEKTN